MAALLKERHHLLALRVSRATLDADGPVTLELQRMVDGQNTLGDRWEVSARDLGAGEAIGPSNPGLLSLPPGVLTPLAEIVEASAEDDEPLWLHLVKPYGVLGALDWEAALAPHLNRAVLRLPDFLERARENPQVLTVALVCDLPSDEPRFDLAQAALNVAVAIATASPRQQTVVHIFASGAWAGRIVAGHPAIVVHTPEPSPDGEPLTWLRWIENSLGGQSVDLIHFLAHGWMVEQSPTLALTSTPEVTQRAPTAQFIGADDIALSLTRTGAWACGFTMPPGASGAVVRYLADNLAQARPGPAFCHPMDDDVALAPTGLEDWIRFLFAPEPQHLAPHLRGFAYCQPTLVAGTVLPPPQSASHDAPQPAEPTPDPIAVAEAADPSVAQEPAWVSAAKRFSENVALQSQRWTGEPIFKPVTGLDDLRNIQLSTLGQSVFAKGAAGSAIGAAAGILMTSPAMRKTAQDMLAALVKLAQDKETRLAAEQASVEVRADTAPTTTVQAPPSDPSAVDVGSGVYEAAVVDDTLRDLQAVVARHMTRGSGAS